MPHGSRAAFMFAVGVSAMTAAMPALGQTSDRSRSQLPSDATSGLARPDRIPPPHFPEPRRDLLPSPSPWSAVPAPGAGSSPGVITERQAMNLLAASGFTGVHLLEPGIDGSWTGYASKQGRTVRATVDPQGNISSR
jgi:hypothetical protein